MKEEIKKMSQDLAVMYHYVMNPKEWKGSVPISENDFSIQVKWLKANYNISTPSIKLQKENEKKVGIISFDDGTRDQYLNAFKILKSENIKGYFTIMSGPLTEKKIPIFHLVHAVLSNIEDGVLWEELKKNFDIPINIKEMSSIYSYETDIYRRYNKYVFNFLLDQKQSRAFLEKKVEMIYGSLDVFIKDFYISASEIKEMYECGMEIGVHCTHHRPYSGDAYTYYMEEIEPCKKYLTELLGEAPKWYTPAFGGGENTQLMLKELTPILKKNGFIGGFTTIEGFCDMTNDDFWHNRVDCNKLEQFLRKEGVIVNA